MKISEFMSLPARARGRARHSSSYRAARRQMTKVAYRLAKKNTRG